MALCRVGVCPSAFLLSLNNCLPNGISLPSLETMVRGVAIRLKTFFAASIVIISSFAFGQAIPQFSTVEPHQYDTINLGTLGIQLNVPVRSKAGHIPFSLSLTGTSQVVLAPMGGFVSLPTLGAQEPHLGREVGWRTDTSCNNGDVYSGFYFTDSDGNTHSFDITVGYSPFGGCGPSTGAAYATDSSGLYMSVDSQPR